ncbi:MAG TPA: hypothetical protein VFV23_00885 [Verrucomicrobiae bacterium]|nr:hypothetical protein [Verrucomicrobiae bacterium]
MIPRLTFVALAAFWVTMNVLLWRAEYGAHGGETPVPVQLVWRKILTAPDASLLSVYENGERTGFCEFTTSIEQEMANLEEDKLPSANLVSRAGYKIRLNGNISLGDFTNRMKFDGRMSFSSRREWREIDFKFSLHNVTAEILAVATNQDFHIKFYGTDVHGNMTLRYSDLSDPGSLIDTVAKNFGIGGTFGEMEWPLLAENSSTIAQSIQWQAHRERLMMGRDPVSAYRLETRILENPIVIHVSTLGEILRVELPGGVTARLDEWSKS